MFSLSDLNNLPPEQKELLLDVTQFALDIIGIFEPTPFADGTNTIISLTRHDWWGAGLSLVGVIPYLGDLAKFGKIPKYVAKVERIIQVARTDGKFAVMVRPVLAKLKAALDRLPLDKLATPVENAVKQMSKKIGDFLGGNKALRMERLTDEMLIKLFGSTKNVGTLVRRNVTTAVECFERKGVRQSDWAGYLKGIDLHAVKPIEVVKFKKGELVAEYIDVAGGSKTGQWMVKAQGAVSHRNIGLSGQGRVRKVFRVKEEVEVLKSKAAGIKDTWTSTVKTHGPHTAPGKVGGKTVAIPAEEVAGGGEQFFMPLYENGVNVANKFLEAVVGGH